MEGQGYVQPPARHPQLGPDMFWGSREGSSPFKSSQPLGRVPHSWIWDLQHPMAEHPLLTHLQEAEQLDLVIFLFLEGDGDMWLHRDPSLHP